jgi:hypothetical protein
MKRYDGGKGALAIEGGEDGYLEAQSDYEAAFDKKSMVSSAMQSSIHLGLGGLGADSSQESNSIYTETDLA